MKKKVKDLIKRNQEDFSLPVHLMKIKNKTTKIENYNVRIINSKFYDTTTFRVRNYYKAINRFF